MYSQFDLDISRLAGLGTGNELARDVEIPPDEGKYTPWHGILGWLKQLLPRHGEITLEKLPLEVIRLIKDVDPKHPEDDIFTFEDPTQRLSPDEIRHITHHIGPIMGPEEVTWPSPLHKVLYLAHLNRPEVYPNLPEYRHSCPEVDRMLMGVVPYTNFTDVSRSGVGWLMAKAYGYVVNSLSKFVDVGENIAFPTNDPKMSNFLSEFGLIGCIPLTDRPSLFRLANQHNLTIHSIGGSSIAESFNSICGSYGNQALKNELSQLAQGEGWLKQAPRKGTSKLSSRFRQYMDTHYPAIHQLLNFTETPPQLTEYLKQRYGDHPQPHVQLLADLMKEMVDKQARLPNNSSKRERRWRKVAYNGSPPFNRISDKDVSELVLSTNSNTPLPPMPWRSFILFPHGQNDKTYATMEQLHRAAKLIKQYYPNATVYIPTRGNQPFTYDLKAETYATEHSLPTGANAIIATIAHISLGSHIHKHFSC